MGSREVLMFGFMFACVWLCDARSHRTRLPPYWGDEAQKPAGVEGEQAAGQEEERPRESPQKAGRLQEKQIQPEPQPLSWRFPEHPEDPVIKRPPIKFELQQQQVLTNRAAVRCGENRIQVEVSQDVLGLGTFIKPEEITLGGCSPTEVDTSSHVLIFESELHSCGSTLVMLEDIFIYAFTLVYKPKVSSRSPIIRSQSAVIGLECHYPRKHTVSSSPLNHAWMPRSDAEVAEGQLYFSLQLMTDDWRFERCSCKYTLSDIINMQVSVIQHGRPPFRVLVDSCVATTSPDPSSERRLDFIKNHGCLGDPNGPRSRFLPQSQSDKIQFQVDPNSFRLLKTIYITCRLKAIPASSATTIEHKACSFDQSRWRAADGQDQFCACCGSTCGMRKARRLDADTDTEEQWKAEVTVGPIVVDDDPFTFSVNQ